MIDLQTIVENVNELSKEVGQYIRNERANFDIQDVQHKGKSDLVSYVDKQAEAQLVNGLKSILPQAGFITEEDTPDIHGEEFTWIIDPLDGTTNFIHGVPPYAISVALMQGDEIVAGVIFEITYSECFSAAKGNGAKLNDRPIKVTPVERIDDSLFSTGFPIYNFEKIDDYLAILNALMKNSHGLRRQGSAAVDLAYVACGRYEGFFEYNLNPWDIAAGIIIIQEAGGKVTDFRGGENFLFGREIVAAGPVHSKLLDVIQRFW